MSLISIVSPVYRAESILEMLHQRLVKTLELEKFEFEIILIEDGSPDNSWEKIIALSKKDNRVKGIKLSRNFGQHYAITAGLEHSKGEWIIVMDCDLQDQPEEIPYLLNKALEGYDLVFAQRIERKDTFSKRLSSKLFYAIFSYLTDTKQDSSIANFGIYNRKVITAILSMKDYIRYFPTLSQWVGYKRAYLSVEHAERKEGKSSYNWKSLSTLAFNNIIAFSDKPLRLMVKFGALISFTTTFLGIFYLIRYLFGEISVTGYASLILSIWFLSGIIILTLGIVGIYIGKIFDKVKDRPVYIVDKKINFND